MLSVNNNSAQASRGKPLNFHPDKLSKQHGSLKDPTLCSTVTSTLDVLLIAGRGSLLGVWTISQHPSGPVPRVSFPTGWGSRGWDPRGPVLNGWDRVPKGWALRIRALRGRVAWGPVARGLFSKVELPPSSLQSTHIAELEVQRLEAVTTED